MLFWLMDIPSYLCVPLLTTLLYPFPLNPAERMRNHCDATLKDGPNESSLILAFSYFRFILLLKGMTSLL